MGFNSYVKLYKNIPMGGYADTFEVIITKDGIKPYNALSYQMKFEIIKYWGDFKEHLINRIEREFVNYNKQKQAEVDRMMKEQEIIKNF